MLALLNVLSHRYYEQVNGSMVAIFMKMRVRMKLSYEYWRKNCRLGELFFHAIDKTLNEMQTLAVANMQKFLNLEDGVPVFGYQKSFVSST